jgi:bis(5'-nucleosidyl)-tetraphosphatase
MKTPATHESAMQPRKAGVVVLRPDAGEWHCLLLRAYRNWGFPKGEIDPGENPLAAAVREVLEETTVADLDFCWGEVFIETAPRSGHQIARYYIAVSPHAGVALPVSAELGRPEHHEFRWAGFAAARTLLAPPLRPVIDWAAQTADTVHAPRALARYGHARRRVDAA